MVSPEDLGWLAGFFDGEGTISTRDKGKGSLELAIVNTDRALLQKAQSILDHLEVDSIINLHTDRNPNHKPCFQLRVRAQASIQKFFNKVPVQSKDKIARWNELRSTYFTRPAEHTKARQARLARSYPVLL